MCVMGCAGRPVSCFGRTEIGCKVGGSVANLQCRMFCVTRAPFRWAWIARQGCKLSVKPLAQICSSQECPVVLSHVLSVPGECKAKAPHSRVSSSRVPHVSLFHRSVAPCCIRLRSEIAPSKVPEKIVPHLRYRTRWAPTEAGPL